MRALVVYPGPNFSVTDVADKLAIGLAGNGVETHVFATHDLLGFYTRARELDAASGEYRPMLSMDHAVHLVLDQLKAAMWNFMPELVVFVSGFFTDFPMLDLMRAHRPHVVIGVCTEQPYETDRELAWAEHLDVCALNDPVHLDRFAEVCPNSFYLPHSFNPDVHHPNGRSSQFDFSFVGTGYPSRIEFLEKVDFDGARVALAGNWQELDDSSPLAGFTVSPDRKACMDNRDTAALYRQTDMSANLYRLEHNPGGSAQGWAMGPREVELAATGTFFARDSRPESDALFPMLPTITDPSELTDVLRWSMSHPELRQAAADEARAAVAGRDCVSMAAALLRRVGV